MVKMQMKVARREMVDDGAEERGVIYPFLDIMMAGLYSVTVSRCRLVVGCPGNEGVILREAPCPGED